CLYGCYSFSGAAISADIKTCSVQLFQNRAPLAPPAFSSQLTEALKQKIVNQTALSLSNNGGDVIFEGSITGYNVQPVALTGGETAELNRLNVSISVKYTNSVDPKQSFETSFTRSREFSAGQNLQTVQNSLIEQLLPELVDDMFNQAFVNW
ncbi:MAG TPA: LptE family protein, partial [Anseongella sp.]|nr:LptE family protein [Anseongella sp.]